MKAPKGKEEISSSTPSATEQVLSKLTSSLPGGGEARPGQHRMARAIEAAIGEEKHLVARAGTGTGKSLAYLVPAILSGKKAVVATATRALQDQLANQDLPFISSHLDHPFTFAVLKGRSNYLCRQRVLEISGATGSREPAQPTLAEEMGSGALAALREGSTLRPSEEAWQEPGPKPESNERASTAAAQEVKKLLAWANTTSSGDRAELPFEPGQRSWSMVSVSASECPGAQRCPSGSTCFAERARHLASSADVVVVNLHLYIAHLSSGSVVLPEHEVVVFDEVHQLEDVATSGLGVEISPGELRWIAGLIRSVLARHHADAQVSEDIQEVAGRLEHALSSMAGMRVDLRPQRHSERSAARETKIIPGSEEIMAAVTSASRQVRRGIEALRHIKGNASLPLASMPAYQGSQEAPSGAEDAGVDPARARALSAASHMVDNLDALADPPEDAVAWVEGSGRWSSLKLAPLNVGPLLAQQLWAEHTCILTSATITPELPQRVGLARGSFDEIDVGSPFSYEDHALLYCAAKLPRPGTADQISLIDELTALILAAGGRTLSLFTSRRSMIAAATALAERIPYRILVQDSLPKAALLAEFTSDETSCLVATMSFWQGVDVPGRSLTLVTIDRIPFPRPDDPLHQARRELAGREGFKLVDLPRAATLLAQGAGRLIRSREDRGVVAVLDPRLATARYRNVLLAGVPPMRRTTDASEAIRFLEEL
ncbi:MAG: ATP-dependent DNA helicase [Actinobacteria bacterium]|nr:ATP-dependent DNA helicase [Actinomycetota bacterium]